MHSNTTILIATPSYNSSKTIARTIASVINQQGDFELIYHIQDGGSTDNTLEVCYQYKRLLEGGSLPVFCNKIEFNINSADDDGMYDAIWQAFNAHDIDDNAWMGWINSDDILRPGALALLPEIDKQHGSNWIKWIGGRTSVCDNHSGMQIGHGARPHNRWAIQNGLCEGLHWDFIQQEGIFFRKSLWESVDNLNGFRFMRFAGDWNLWRMFAKNAELFQVPWATGSFFRVEGQISGETRYLYEAEICSVLDVKSRTQKLLQATDEDVAGWLIGTAYTTGEVYLTKTDQKAILEKWRTKHTDKEQTSVITEESNPNFSDYHHYSSILTTDRINNSIILHETDWQYPAITEKHAAFKANQLLPEVAGNCYLAFPWATLVDMIECSDKRRMELFAKLSKYREIASKHDRVFTTCQHVLQYKYERLLQWAGVTDVFWSHHTNSPARSFKKLRVKPFPLYPLQAVVLDSERTTQDDDETPVKDIRCSFVGARYCDGYISQIRDWIIDDLSGEEDFVILSRDGWHYQRDVYGKQIESGTSVNDADDSKERDASNKAAEYIDIMKHSLYTLCPSGSGPNSIRLWESIAIRSIPVVMSDMYILPGAQDLWREAGLFLPESQRSVQQLKSIIRGSTDNEHRKSFDALSQISLLYGPHTFITDIIMCWIGGTSEMSSTQSLYTNDNLRGDFAGRLRRILSLNISDIRKKEAIKDAVSSRIRYDRDSINSSREDIVEILTKIGIPADTFSL